MTTEAEKAREAQSKRNWLRAIIALSVVFVLGIGAVVYYGGVVLPAENKAKDIVACKTYLVGYQNAKLAFLAEENATAHKPSAVTAVKAYAQAISDGYNKAFDQIGDVNGTVGKALKTVAIERLYLDTRDTTAMANTFSSLDNAAGTADQICNSTLSSANVKHKYGSYTPAPAVSPSAGK